MRRWITRIVLGLLAVLLVAGVAGYWYLRPLLLTGTGYASHSACAMAEFAGAGPDLPSNPLVPYLRNDVNRDGASSTVLGVLAKQRSWYTPGYGCTLSSSRPDFGSFTAVSANDLSKAPAPTASPEVEAALAKAFGDDLLDAGQDTLGTRAVVVLKGGELVAERYAEGFDATTPQLGWSMAKSVTSLLVGRLVEQGGVELDDTQLRPEWTDGRADISIDDLLRMTSGLSWDETYDLGTPITRMLYLESDMAGYVASLDLAHPVGEFQQYSSGSTTLLCSVLTERTRIGADLPRQKLFAPLGLSSAVWEPDAAGTPVCGSYLWASPRDWASIGQFALQDGVWNGKRLLPEGWMAETTTVKPVAATDEVGYAAGWRVNTSADGSLPEPVLPADTYWAVGHDGQRMYVVPSADLVVVRMGFSPDVASEDLRTEELVADVIAALG
ncbi:serine hydrolase domain-containing protein [Tessaracoccus antarcticus]|uniref:Class C beta-lactamase-related serine hydrolase n=1 Tax=Tessaracoccus antarcticus TaxID=2479848 RepID=A0A3M0GF28_9ACTN|nr:serine hydrolase [Tessaracoccus antarcticus]RMB61272.1 class C beta-lactamase-related serine hydrolase [Tessaracoccus antarcticus]